jgi:hypothetical protein
LPGDPVMSTSTTVDLPSIDLLTPEQKTQLLTVLIKDELSRQPIPMPIILREGEKVLGQFNPKMTFPTKTTLPPVPEGFWEEVAKKAQNPGRTFTLEEIEALEASGDDEWLLR